MHRLFRTGALALVPLLFAGCTFLRASAQPDDSPNALPGIDLLTRTEWKAEPAKEGLRPHTPVALTIHHTGTLQKPDQDPAETLRALQRFSFSSDTLGNGHPKLPWPDVPYHYYISPDGTIVEGRDVRFEGSSNTDYDLHGQIQVVVEGNFMEEEPTAEQVASLIRLSGALSERWGIPATRTGGHRDRAGLDQTVCPGDALVTHFPEVLAAMHGG